MNVPPETINTELKKLSVYYPQAKRSQAEIVLLTEMWVEDLGHLTSDVFLGAVRRHRQRSEYFPTGKDILDICNDIWAERQRAVKELPEPIPDDMLTPAEMAANIVKFKEKIGGIG